MNEDYNLRRFEEACGLLPQRLRVAALEVDKAHKIGAEELRLRVGRPVHLTLPNGEIPVPNSRVISSDLAQVVDRATEFSRYASAESIRRGHVTAKGGFRVGLCGTAVTEGGRSLDIRDISSLAIRIPRVCEDAARPLLPELLESGRLCSTLILSPPGGGKTTLLRDLVRLVSQGTELAEPMRVSLVDERGELAAVYRGQPQLDVGICTDVMDGCPKHLAVPMLLRAMNPRVIALDEIALKEDVAAVLMAAGCGASLLATAHASDRQELASRPVGQALLDCGVFRRLAVITGRGERRRIRVEVLP